MKSELTLVHVKSSLTQKRIVDENVFLQPYSFSFKKLNAVICVKTNLKGRKASKQRGALCFFTAETSRFLSEKIFSRKRCGGGFRLSFRRDDRLLPYVAGCPTTLLEFYQEYKTPYSLKHNKDTLLMVLNETNPLYQILNRFDIINPTANENHDIGSRNRNIKS